MRYQKESMGSFKQNGYTGGPEGNELMRGLMVSAGPALEFDKMKIVMDRGTFLHLVAAAGEQLSSIPPDTSNDHLAAIIRAATWNTDMPAGTIRYYHENDGLVGESSGWTE